MKLWVNEEEERLTDGSRKSFCRRRGLRSSASHFIRSADSSHDPSPLDGEETNNNK